MFIKERLEQALRASEAMGDIFFSELLRDVLDEIQKLEAEIDHLYEDLAGEDI